MMLNFKSIFKFVALGLLFSCSKAAEIKYTQPRGENKDVIDLIAGNNVYGRITDIAGKGISGVSVSDGFTVVQTDKNGIYQFKKNATARFVHYSTPSAYAINVANNNNNPIFYSALESTTNPRQYNFILTENKANDTKFLIYGIGDPQVANTADVDRFTNETLADIKGEMSTTNLPIYGLSLGDVVADQPQLMGGMKSLLGSTTMPVFTTIGNHDKTASGSNIKNGNLFESHFGPSNYSFSRGNVHFVCMDNVVFAADGSYTMNLSKEQLDWLEQDLSFVNKQHMLVLFTHMPIRNSNFAMRSRLFDLLQSFKETHIMVGHTHYAENFIHKIGDRTISEHIHGATCGAWWKSTINGDGTPNGYAVYQVEGNTLTDWYYKPTKLSRNFQMRLHWADVAYGGDYGYFNYANESDILVANVWNADPSWKVEVFMDGKKLGDMQLSGTFNRDAWSKGYHLGVLNRNPANYNTVTTHLYTLKVNNPNGTLKVVATDRFGKVYEQTAVTTNLSTAKSYQ